jgi:hypothetical protein
MGFTDFCFYFFGPFGHPMRYRLSLVFAQMASTVKTTSGREANEDMFTLVKASQSRCRYLRRIRALVAQDGSDSTSRQEEGSSCFDIGLTKWKPY